MTALTEDAFFRGRVRLLQHRDGYRYSVDAVLLAYAARNLPARTAVDLGTGCGIVPLLIAFQNPDIRIFAVEIQNALADLALRNFRINDLSERIRLIHQDLRDLRHGCFGTSIDLVVSNPPYRKSRSGRLNANPERAAARHEIHATLTDVIAAAGRLLNISGRLLMIYPAGRMTDLISEMRRLGIEPKSIRMVHSVREGEARLILVEGVKGGRPEARVGPPLVVFEENGRYTDALAEMFDPPEVNGPAA